MIMAGLFDNLWVSVCEGEMGGGVCPCEVLFSADDNGSIVQQPVGECVRGRREEGCVSVRCCSV